MFSKILIVLIILCSFDYVINYKVSTNINSIISDKKKVALPSPFTGKTFHKNGKTSGFFRFKISKFLILLIRCLSLNNNQ